MLLAADAGASKEAGKTIGLAVTDMRWALYETPNAKEECPAGVQVAPVVQFKAMPGAPAERLQKYGYEYSFFGPNGENAEYDPLAVTDPLPWKELQTKNGYGLNLDGTTDGHATAKTCKHEKFTSPEGEQVDNQFARAGGCVEGFRTGGFASDFNSNEVVTSPINRHLIEITGVDSEENDPSVEVTIYKGKDGLVRRADGKTFVSFMTQRVDNLFPQFILHTHGRIVDGVLITDPIPLARLPLLYIQVPHERRIEDLRLRLKLTPDGAEGIMAGYEPIEDIWTYLSKSPSAGAGKYSSAGLFRALLRYADGSPDATGHCMSISTTYKVNAVRAIIARPQTAASRTAPADTTVNSKSHLALLGE